MKPRKGQLGQCKLTGALGPLVKSHLIPRALAPPREGGEPFAQFGGGQRPIRRFDSWYDLSIVTRVGEDILTGYDTFAIREMRRLKLIWQSWGPMLSLCTTDWVRLPGTPNGIRRVVFSDAPRMRLFFLSLLWRASVSGLPEFKEIDIKASDARRLRNAVRDGATDLPDEFFPVTLTQISTRGEPHNLGPISQLKRGVAVEKYKSKDLHIFRFYFDGLVAHVHTSTDGKAVDGLWPMLVGPEDGTTLSMVTWEASSQASNMVALIREAEREYPGGIARAEGRGAKPSDTVG